jgi:prephenate dehydratase
MRARYAFLGPEGTFAHAALRSLPGADEAELVPMATVTLAIIAVRDGTVDGALVPLENSVEGAVPATLDELAGGDLPLHIAQETYLPVEFDLLARPGTGLGDVQTVATHPHAEAQVRRYLLEVLPEATYLATTSTAVGAQRTTPARSPGSCCSSKPADRARQVATTARRSSPTCARTIQARCSRSSPSSPCAE